jgi:hypothetical protein
MKNDMQRRQNPKPVRADNGARKYDVELAHEWIYENGTAIDSAAIKRLLVIKSQSSTRIRRYRFIV